MPLKTYGILNKSWPLYRGKRAVKQVKLREITRRWPVQVIQSRESTVQRGCQQLAHAVIRITVFLSKEHLYRIQLTIETTGYLVSCYTAHSSTTQTNPRKISNSFDILLSSINIVNSSKSPHEIMDKCCYINLSGLTFLHTNIRSLRNIVHLAQLRDFASLCSSPLPVVRGLCNILKFFVQRFPPNAGNLCVTQPEIM